MTADLVEGLDWNRKSELFAGPVGYPCMVKVAVVEDENALNVGPCGGGYAKSVVESR